MAEQKEPAARGAEPGGTPKRKRRRRRRFHPISAFFKIIGTILLVCVTTGVLLVGFAAVYINTVIIPEASNLDYMVDMSMSLTSTMYYTDERGQAREYLTISSDENRVWVPYDQIPEDLLRATVATEDKRFYSHHGVDWIRTARGVLNMFTGGSVQGGSTLTQQLIKNITGEDQTTVKRKITEIFRALEFDKSYSKETTLEWYLNYIFFGERCYGIYTASYMYFGKDISQLTLPECACLIGIPNNPSRYDPYLNKSAKPSNDEALRSRAKDVVLWSMFDQGMISEAEYEEACAEVDAIEFTRGNADTTVNSTVYNWYQDQVLDDVIKDLMEKYDWSARAAALKVYYGGLSIYTNVDPRVQSIVEEVYGDPDNLPYASNSGQPLQSAITVVDNTGRVVALSGGIGDKTVNRGWNRASDTKRPPGSSIKPLAVYGPALEMGLITPYSVVDDTPYQRLNERAWPVNAYGYYRGRTNISYALAVSSNTVAVRTLGDMVTKEASYNFLQDRFHISSLVWETWINDDKYSDMDLAPLSMGGLTNGVSTYEMAAAYAAFPSMGRYVPPTTYSKVLDADGVTVLLDTSNSQEYILKETTAYYMNTLLRGVVTSPYGTATKATLGDMPVAGKTGTTTSEKDLWFVGYTPYYTAAVWTGYDRQEQMKNVGLPTVDLWKKVMSRLHEDLEPMDFPLPNGVELVSAAYCLDSGMKAGEACALDARGSRVATGTFVKGDEPRRTCDMHTTITVCTHSVVVSQPGGPDENGEVTGPNATPVFYLAGPDCPEDQVRTIGVLDYVREGVAAEVPVRDSGALLSNWDGVGLCTVHGNGGEPDEGGYFDPNDPSTWPTGDPDFDINDPNTWPEYPEELDPSPQPSGEPATGPETGDEPGTEPPAVTHEPEPTPSPPPPEDEPPVEDEPFVPAGP